MKRKRRKLKKGPIIILFFIIILLIFGLTRFCTKKENNPPKDDQSETPITPEVPVEPVIPEKKSPLEMSVEEFTLEGYFEGTVLTEKEASDEYMNEVIFAGDSMALYYVINKLIPGKRLWHQVSINPLTAITTKIYVNHIDSGKTFKEVFQERQPKVVIMTLGTNGIATMQTEYFVEKYKEFLTELKEVSPNTRLIVQSIPPVDKKYDDEKKAINNDKINKTNYYIAQMCEELGLEFLFSANSMKDENGACKKGYCITKDGIHPDVLGNTRLYEYAKSHIGL